MSKIKIDRVRRKLNTLKRAEAVQARFKVLSMIRVEGMKISSTEIVKKLCEEFFICEQTVYLFLKIDTVGKISQIQAINPQKELF